MAVGIGHRWAGFPISGTLIVMESRQPSDRKRARTRRPSLSDPSRRTTDGLRNPSEVSAWHSSGCYGTKGQRMESESTGRSLAFEQEPMLSLTSPYPRTSTGQDGCPCHGCGQHRPCLLERTFSAYGQLSGVPQRFRHVAARIGHVPSEPRIHFVSRVQLSAKQIDAASI